MKVFVENFPIFSLFFALIYGIVNGHIEGSGSSSSSSSSESSGLSDDSDNSKRMTKIPETRANKRKSFGKTWKFEGMSIDVPMKENYRRKNIIPNKLLGDDTKPTTYTEKITSTTSKGPQQKPLILPPLDPKYRRIYNPDEDARIQDHPYMASLLFNNELWCGAVIIDTDLLLTAAHCLQLQYNNRFFREYVKMLTVRVGSSNSSSGGKLMQVSEIFFHPNYKPPTLEYNIAAIRLHRNLSIENSFGKIGTIDYKKAMTIESDAEINFLGWGSVLGGTGGAGGQVLLQKVILPVYDLNDCQDIYGKDLVTRINFCAGFISQPKNVCNHDAGGPAILDGLLVGILSFSSSRCDQPDKPAVFTHVGAVTNWIEAVREKKHPLFWYVTVITFNCIR